jgi:hypothetical protein
MSVDNLLAQAQQRYSDYLKGLKALRACKGDLECFIRQSNETWHQYQAYDTAKQQYESALAESADAATLAPPRASPNRRTLENKIRELWRNEWPAD